MQYHDLYDSGELLCRVKASYRKLFSCDLCPHACGVNRLKGEIGCCRSGYLPRIASANLHRGEEPPISGTQGSGTIFFSGCTMGCIFCQNFPISHLNNGKTCSTRKLAEKMLQLQRRGAHNINFVTPSHFMPQILAALWLAIPQGFSLPILWNSNGYERVDALGLLDGIVSVYLPDMKYAGNSSGRELSGIERYRDINRLAIQEMFRQVGHLELNDSGIARKGLIIRHLVLPDGTAGTAETLNWIRSALGSETHISLMSQYFPAGRATSVPAINRGLTEEEYDAALEALDAAGLENGWVQELDQERQRI